MKKLLAPFLLLLFVVSVHAQRDFSQVQIKATKVAGNVYMLEGAGGNIGVSVGDDGILIVDDQFAPLADKIRAALKGIADRKLRFILNTHWHGDHTGGNEAFGRRDHRCEAAFHVGRPARVQHAVLDNGLERIRSPFFARPGRHDIGVPGETKHRAGIALACPQVLDRPERHALKAKAKWLQPLAEQFHAAVVLRTDRRAS